MNVCILGYLRQSKMRDQGYKNIIMVNLILVIKI